MENSKRPKIIVTDGYKVEHKKFIDKMVLNSILPVTSAPYIFHDPSVAERITEEAMFIQNSVIKTIADKLVLVVGAGKTHLHHMIPTHYPPMSIHDILKDRIDSTPSVFSEIFEKKLDFSKLIVSLQDNNQKD